MADSREDAPLDAGSLAGSEEALVPRVVPRGSSNKRALKIAGLTTLACLLLASQVFTAYMVFNQKQEIHSLQRNSERMSKQLTRSSHAMNPMKMAMPMNTLPLLMDFSDEDPKKTKEPPKDKAVDSVEKQLMGLLKDSGLPQFNETFLANLESLKQHMNDSMWESFESWMRHWLIFQMAQQQPAAPTPQPASLIQTKCQMEAAPGFRMIGSFKPQCDEEGHYKRMQCYHATGFCWCVDDNGTPIEGTAVRGRLPDCDRARGFRRMLARPRLMQKTVAFDEK